MRIEALIKQIKNCGNETTHHRLDLASCFEDFACFMTANMQMFNKNELTMRNKLNKYAEELRGINENQDSM